MHPIEPATEEILADPVNAAVERLADGKVPRQQGVVAPIVVQAHEVGQLPQQIVQLVDVDGMKLRKLERRRSPRLGGEDGSVDELTQCA